MPSLKNRTIEQLFQALGDAENAAAWARSEIIERLTAQHPKLFPAMRTATQFALDKPSMMARSRIK